MKSLITTLLSLLMASLFPLAMGKAVSHDISSLPKWGPYSKEYFGISHIEDLSSGMQVEWKDQVYVDATYHIIDHDRVLLEARCINQTPLLQNISLQLAVRKSGGGEEQWTPEIKQGNNWFTVRYPEI